MPKYEIADAFIDIDVENDLTKAVFGCLQLLSKEALNEILSSEEFDFTFSSEPRFTFHETVDRREPDVIIEDGRNLTVMVEAKLDAPTDPTQLSDEYADLRQGWDSEKLRLLHLTKDRQRPQKIDSDSGIPSEDFVWTNWRELATSVLNVDSTSLSTADQHIVEMLIQVFENNGFVPFRGFKLMREQQSLSDQLEQAYSVRGQYYDDVNSFRKDVETHLPDEIRFWRFFRRGISGGMGSGKKSFPSSSFEKMPRNLWFSYVPLGEVPNLAKDNYLENYLFMDFNSKTGDLRVGYTVTTAGGKVEDDVFRRTFHARKEDLIQLIEENDYQPYTTSYSLSNNIDSIDGLKNFLEAIDDPSYNHSDLGRRVLITRTWSADELPIREDEDEILEPAEVTRDIADALIEIHRLTYIENSDIFYPAVV